MLTSLPSVFYHSQQHAFSGSTEPPDCKWVFLFTLIACLTSILSLYSDTTWSKPHQRLLKWVSKHGAARTTHNYGNTTPGRRTIQQQDCGTLTMVDPRIQPRTLKLRNSRFSMDKLFTLFNLMLIPAHLSCKNLHFPFNHRHQSGLLFGTHGCPFTRARGW